MKKIVLTGAPSSGKTTLLQKLETLAIPGICFVPESAVVLLSGGFPIPSHDDLEQIRCFQNAILPLQESLELILRKKILKLPT